MKHLIITIAREYGSGGRLIGQRLAEELQIGCYNKELITLTTQESGFSAGYYNYFTQNKWGKAQNYHLSIDSSIGVPNAIRVLRELVAVFSAGER